MKGFALVLVSTSGIVTGPANAMTGNELLALCENLDRQPQSFKALECLDYIEGFNDAWENARNAFKPAKSDLDYCSPTNGTVGQMARVVLKHLRENPKDLHGNAGILAHRALAISSPCKK